MMCLEESKGAPPATSLAHLVDGTVDLVVATSLETLATPPVRLAGPWPEAVLRPMVCGSASPTIAILLWAVKGEVIVGTAPKANLSSFVLLWLLLFGPVYFHLLSHRLLLPRLPFLLG